MSRHLKPFMARVRMPEAPADVAAPFTIYVTLAESQAEANKIITAGLGTGLIFEDGIGEAAPSVVDKMRLRQGEVRMLGD